MSLTKNSAAIFNSVPQAYPILDETILNGHSTIDLENVPLSGVDARAILGVQSLDACKTGARVVLCGAISQYNTPERYAIKDMIHVLFKRLRLEGLHVVHGEQQYEGELNSPTKFLSAMVPLIQSGQIKWSEQVYKGIESAGEGIFDV